MIKIKPVFSEKIWGGSKLKQFGFDIPSDKTGEAWLISGYKGNESLIEGEKLNLQEYYKANPEKFNNYPTEEFPLLVKILDASEVLSVQIHPDDKLAQKLENYPFGKTECWYVLDHDDNAEIIVGSKTTNLDEIKNFIKNNEWKNIYKTIKSEKGLALNINAGTIHAIGKGNLIYELQQSSDITYRFYDFERLEKGQPRELHIDKAIKCIKPDKDIYQKPKIVLETNNYKITTIIENDLFNLEKWEITHKTSIKIDVNKKNFLIFSNIDSKELVINNITLKLGESAIVTADDLENNVEISSGKLLVANPK